MGLSILNKSSAVFRSPEALPSCPKEITGLAGLHSQSQPGLWHYERAKPSQQHTLRGFPRSVLYVAWGQHEPCPGQRDSLQGDEHLESVSVCFHFPYSGPTESFSVNNVNKVPDRKHCKISSSVILWKAFLSDKDMLSHSARCQRFVTCVDSKEPQIPINITPKFLSQVHSFFWIVHSSHWIFKGVSDLPSPQKVSCLHNFPPGQS